MLWPGVILLLLFHYRPLYGLVIAFKHYQITDLDMLAAPWAGLYHFRDFLTDPDFYNVLRNSIGINVLGLIVGFPIPIVFALFLNEIRNLRFKRVTQTVSYLPHFISWVVYGGIVINLLSPSFGIVNAFLLETGIVKEPVFFMGHPGYFWPIAVLSRSAKEFGWGAILYLSAMSGIDSELYEAAYMDGANRYQRMWHITLPGVLGTMVILLILTVSNILNWGFDQIWMLQNHLNLDTSDTLETYVYRRGLINLRFAYATAVGLMKSVIAVILLVITNTISTRVTEKGLY
jgi:putative aldouronate transport system permease protein